MAEDVFEADGISLLSHSIPEIGVLSGLQFAILNFGSRPTSGNIGGVTGEYGMADSVGWSLEFR